MRIVSVMFSVAADGRAVNIDRDTILSQVSTGAKAAVVSTDPAATVANTVSAPADTQLKTAIALFPTGGSAQNLKTDFPLSGGEVIFCSCAGTFVQLFFTDPS
jgi:hypothetical protein